MIFCGFLHISPSARSLGESTPVSDLDCGGDPHYSKSIVQLVPHGGRHAVSPCGTLPGWKVRHELEVAAACHLL